MIQYLTASLLKGKKMCCQKFTEMFATMLVSTVTQYQGILKLRFDFQ